MEGWREGGERVGMGASRCVVARAVTGANAPPCSPLVCTLNWFNPCVQFFTNAAEALPCELGPDGKTPVTRPQGARQQGRAAQQGGQQQGQQQAWRFAAPSRFQQAWDRRVQAQRAAGWACAV